MRSATQRTTPKERAAMPPRPIRPARTSNGDAVGGIEGLRRAAQRAVKWLPGVRRILLYGSLVTPEPMLRADAVILVEVTTSTHSDPRERVSAVARALRPLPCRAELFVLTSEEIERFSAEGSPLLRTILRDGVSLMEAS